MDINNIENIADIDLYEILDVKKDVCYSKIKKAYKSLVLRVHPDKTNGDSEQFELVNLAYTVLKSEKLRKLYDKKRNSYLNNKCFNDLKNISNNLNNSIPGNKDEAIKKYKILEEELNKKHNFNPLDIDIINNSDMNNRLNELNLYRSKIDNNLKKNVIKRNINSEDFNEEFINSSNRINETKDIVAYNSNNLSITNYSLINENNLYCQNSNSTRSFSTINDAFNLTLPVEVENKYNTHNLISSNDKKMIDSKINEHKQQILNKYKYF